MVNIFIVGLGRGASFVLDVLKDLENINILGALERNKNAFSVEKARLLGIPVYFSLDEIPEINPEMVLNLTGDDSLNDVLKERFKNSEIFSGKGSKIIFELLSVIKKDSDLYHSLYQATVLLLSKEKVNEVLNSIINEALKVLKFPAASIALYDPRYRGFSLVVSAGLSKNILALQKWKPRKGGLTSAILDSKVQPFVIEDIEKAEFEINPLLKKEGIRFVAATKLTSQDNLLGILYVDDFVPRKMTEYERKTLNLFAQIAGLALEKFKLIEENREMAITDGLTGLNNHRYFHERLSQEFGKAKRAGRPLSVLLVDVDYFKKYNDANGHLAGDEALKRIATLIRENIRIGDVAARYGGEEFAIILSEVDKETAKLVAERLRKAVETEVFAGEESLPQKKLTVSVGVSTFPEDASTKDELIKKADDALYLAKLRGRNCIVCAGEDLTF